MIMMMVHSYSNLNQYDLNQEGAIDSASAHEKKNAVGVANTVGY